MNTKILSLFLMLLLIVSPALAAITVTISSPTSGISYNNLPANIKKIPITFAITDSNTDAPSDFNVTIKWGSINTTQASGTVIIKDFNIFDYNTDSNPTGTLYCDVTDEGPSAATCTYMWELPSDTAAPQGRYWIDVNGTEWFKTSLATEADKNASVWFNFNNKMSTGASTRELMSIVGMVLAGLVLLGGLTAVAVFKTDITTTAITTVVAAIAVALAAMIIGIVLIPL